MQAKDILARQIGREARIVFVHPYDPAFVQACKALKLRGLLAFGENPIVVPGVGYKAWYADIIHMDAQTYARYAMLVRDFYTNDLRAKFDALFPDIQHNKVEATVHNPSKTMEANRAEVERLVEKYRNTTSPLEFYGSRHQAEGVVLFIHSKKLKAADGIKGVINADAPRMGKTRQAVVGAIEIGAKNILVITTKTAKTAVWPDQIKTVDPRATIFLADHKHYLARAQWTIAHWDTLRLCDDRFFDNAKTFDLIILDESHYASNEESQRGRATARLCDQIPLVWQLTGTPVTKRPRNAIHLLQLIRHPLVNTKSKVWHFLTRYCGDQDEWGRWDFDRAKNLDELHALLQDVLIRREKDQTNLPPKVRQVQVVHLTPAQREAYNHCWETYLEDPKHAEAAAKPGYPTEMVQKMVRRHSVAMAKVPLVIDWAEGLLAAGEKVVIFTAFDDVWEAYAKHFGSRAVGIRGEVTPKARAEAVQRFQTDPSAQVFIGNAVAASEAIPLWAAGYLAFNDITWLPHNQLQAEERIVGGDKKTCFITFFLAEDTEDEGGFQDFLKHKDITQRIVNRRDENNKPIDPGFVGEVPRPADDGGPLEGNKTMQRLAALLDAKAMRPGDTRFAQSIHDQFLDKGRISPKQTQAIRRLVYRYRDALAGPGGKK